MIKRNKEIRLEDQIRTGTMRKGDGKLKKNSNKVAEANFWEKRRNAKDERGKYHSRMKLWSNFKSRSIIAMDKWSKSQTNTISKKTGIW